MSNNGNLSRAELLRNRIKDEVPRYKDKPYAAWAVMKKCAAWWEGQESVDDAFLSCWLYGIVPDAAQQGIVAFAAGYATARDAEDALKAEAKAKRQRARVKKKARVKG